MAIFSLALKSLFNRKLTFLITLFSIAISITLILGVQTLKDETKISFMKSISGTDLIVGARGASSPLLLSTVFHIGNTTNTIKYDSFEDIRKSSAVEWAVPISMGDSHKGYTVLGTELSFFEHFSYANKQSLVVQSGNISNDMFSAVIGSDVANKLGYQVGDEIIMTHGGGEIEGHDHDNITFHIGAVLAPSFTAIDQTLVISLEAMEAMHADSDGHFGVLSSENSIDTRAEQHSESDHEHAEHEGHQHHESQEQRVARLMEIKPENINAVFVGLKSKHVVLGMQNYVNNYDGEPLSAIIPTVALQELWAFFSIAEVALNIVSGFVVLVGLLGMLSIILMSLNERRREMAILRSMGARPVHIFSLIIGEAAVVCLSGILLGIILLYGLLFLLQAPLANHFGFYLDISGLNLNDGLILLSVQVSAIVIAIIPGLLIYKTSLSDGMSIKF
ncbi:hypothetical protein A6E05_00200 [Aliivibrio sp. 1S165]|uniref:ABC transporter permease n=1 Tax=unclassified Aliivibrio TaxID=2645654 RepID=UPI00080E8E82|nr:MULTISPECIES: ABC transporter permease [unclassified Aliivibrio]OCH18811.1 hypothetical protein A6E05_00200 [Aliivibrio sp. 1S165]OCH30995.1 hypothetical protein A6E06_05310 [Aliivibrio sp. 1S175]